MKTFKYLTFAVLAISLAACGGKGSESEDSSENEKSSEVVSSSESSSLSDDDAFADDDDYTAGDDDVTTAAADDDDYSAGDDDDSYSSSSSRSSSSTDWDDVLNEYEKYVDKYIALVKKASNGDASAMAEYASMAAQAESLSRKLENARGEMSSAQLARYTRITQKMARAAEQM